MTDPRGLIDPHPTTITRAPFADTAQADERVFAMVEQQATWVGTVVREVGTVVREAGTVACHGGAVAADPGQWLFAQRERFKRDGACDPWAEQMLYRAGLLPR